MLTAKSKKYIWITILLHLAAVIFSVGFYTHDEQREVLQIVGHKLGMYDSSYLSIQYHSGLRAWLHPSLYIYPAKIYGLFFKLNPFHLAFLFRFISSLLGISSLWVLYKSFEKKFNLFASQNIYFFFVAFIWFFPYLQARTANENLCFSFFCFGFYFLNKEETWKNAIFAGVLFAMSFVMRFQMVVMITSTVLWFLIFQRYSFKKYLILTLSFLLFMVFSTGMDSLFYGHFSFTPWNYYNINIIQKYAAQFGETPWYDYILLAFRYGPAPTGILYIAAFIVLWIRFPKSLLTWITLPFYLVHTLIGHKELRFIFPVAFFLPLVLTYLITDLKLNVKRWWVILFLVTNVPILLYTSLTPASNLMGYYKYLYYKDEPVTKVYVTSPFEDFTKFYLKNDIKYPLIKFEEMDALAKTEKQSFFFTMNLKERDLLLGNPGCKVDFSLFPQWIYEIEFIKKRRTFKSWTMVECLKP